ncbi:MAG TPA: RluA family pseudouridine synthase [Nevskiaceae bacterium]|nr:RluA family pseudouridine synthase [Nevskiaceae bacterium]
MVLFEDETILLLNKPAGLVVNKAKTVKQATLQDWLQVYLKLKGRGIGARAGIVHRLDKETSGLILVAKTEKAFVDLQKQFKERKVKKKYLALVHGHLETKKGVIKASISRNPFDRKKFGVFLGGREAETEYKLLKNYKHQELGSFSLLKLTPKTGRTHQIRVHLKYIGHPVVADKQYAGRKTARQDRQWCPRQFLHASLLAFRHPETGKRLKFACLLPNELKKALEVLK